MSEVVGAGHIPRVEAGDMADDGSAWVSQPRAHTAVPSALQWPARGPAWGSAVHHPALRRACVFASVLVVASVLLVTIGQPRDSDSFHAPIPIDIECPAFSGGAVKVTMCHLDRATYASVCGRGRVLVLLLCRRWSVV